MRDPTIDQATFEDLRVAFGGDFVAELVETFVAEATEILAALKDADAALDAEGLWHAAHSLKSMSASLGALELSRLARDLEILGREGKIREAGGMLAELEGELTAAEHELQERTRGA